MSLFTLAEEIRRCTACPLWKSRTLAVAGDGAKDAKVMFIGEAPGEEENRLGLPFIGKSGKFLDEMLKVAGLKREDCFITGAVKCHPPKSRIPLAKEVKVCREKWLNAQIEALGPKVIVLLGNTAIKSLLGKGKVSELHGQLIEGKYFVTFHPAAAMRFSKVKEMMEEDFKKLRNLKK